MRFKNDHTFEFLQICSGRLSFRQPGIDEELHLRAGLVERQLDQSLRISALGQSRPRRDRRRYDEISVCGNPLSRDGGGFLDCGRLATTFV